jgi:putative redox protein
MSMAKPTVAASLAWQGDLRFLASATGGSIAVDGDSKTAISPVEALVVSLAACMAADVVAILTKGRHAVRALEANLVAERAEHPPRRLTQMTIALVIRGDVPPAAIERAIALSRDKYCSVWHSLRSDIELFTSYEVAP